MLKQVLTICLLSVTLNQTIFASTQTVDALGMAGQWMCHGYDMHDGYYDKAALTLTLDAKDSDFANNYGAYHFNLKEPDGTVFLGEVAASGNEAAVYFENTSPGMKTDRGVGIATISWL